MLRSDRLAALRGFAVLLAMALLLALLAAACNGDDKDEAPPAGETPAAGETPTTDGEAQDGDGDGDDGTDGDGGGLQELEALAAEASKGVTAKVVYRVVVTGMGEDLDGELVLVQRPPDSRFEIVVEEGGEEFRTIVINAGGNAYVCTSIAGVESCLATETEATEEETSLLDPLLGLPQELAADTEDVDLIDTSGRQIAGVDATCFTVSGALADLGEGEGEVCFSDEGLLLYLSGESDGTSSVFEATSVSTDVTDEDFEPPYDILDLSGLEGLEDLDLPGN
jgi:hypothetical protein